jgi:uncharacterized protein YutE (UPF0331/DUF86 family)
MPKMKNEGLQLYLAEVLKHKKKYLTELDELREDLLADNFKSRDYLATERLLQIFTELCIGLAKHCLKKAQGHSATDAYQTFSLLKEHDMISSNELMQWKKIIGLRNGLVHDYLNIDLLIIEHIIRQRQYLQLDAFISKAVDILQEADG